MVVDTRREDLAALGASPEQIDDMLGQAAGPAGGAFRVLPCNWPAVEVFLAMETQWDVMPPGVPVRLVYEALPAVLDIMGVKKRARRDIFRRLKVIEAAVLDYQKQDIEEGA